MRIVRWIRIMRSSELALRQIFSPEQWDSIVKEAMFRTVKLDPGADEAEEVVSAIGSLPDAVRTRLRPKLRISKQVVTLNQLSDPEYL